MENRFIVGKCLFEVFELSHFAFQSLLCGLNGLLLSLQWRDRSQVLIDFLLSLVHKRRRERSQQVLLFGIGRYGWRRYVLLSDWGRKSHIEWVGQQVRRGLF